MKTSYISKPHYDEKGFDTFVRDDDNKLYAIFDGMGISEGARYASTYCMEQTIARAPEFNTVGGVQLARVLDQYASHIGSVAPRDGTTGVIVQLGAQDQLEWALMGDSRIYIFRDGDVIQIGRDEGEGNLLNNYIGQYTLGCQQWGTVPNWDKFMICSDGITGDWPDQFIDREDMQKAFQLETPRAICNKFIELSNKPDDKTIIVGIK